jgi:tubulin polyglutamylase TTLL2
MSDLMSREEYNSETGQQIAQPLYDMLVKTNPDLLKRPALVPLPVEPPLDVVPDEAPTVAVVEAPEVACEVEVKPLPMPEPLPMPASALEVAPEVDTERIEKIPLQSTSKPKRCLLFKTSEVGPPVVRNTLRAKGWVECTEGPDVPADQPTWNLHWRSGRFKPSEYTNCTINQLVNHFPKSSIITRKDTLLRALRKMRKVHGSVYNFFPDGFFMPTEYTKFVEEYSKQETKAIWICKPNDSSRGRNIFLFRDLADLVYSDSVLVQQYVDRPMLIGGYKLDLRLYVLVTSFHPMRVWLFKDGLVRFSTEKYDQNLAQSDLKNVFSHLTNSSINKFSATLAEDKDVIGAGCKWDLKQFREWYENNGYDYEAMWANVVDLVNLTLIMCPTVVPRNESCFELYGFDVIIDEAQRASLLEVNCSPALGQDCDTDFRVKDALVADTLDVLSLHFNKLEAAEEEQKEKENSEDYSSRTGSRSGNRSGSSTSRSTGSNDGNERSEKSIFKMKKGQNSSNDEPEKEAVVVPVKSKSALAREAKAKAKADKEEKVKAEKDGGEGKAKGGGRGGGGQGRGQGKGRGRGRGREGLGESASGFGLEESGKGAPSEGSTSSTSRVAGTGRAAARELTRERERRNKRREAGSSGREGGINDSSGGGANLANASEDYKNLPKSIGDYDLIFPYSAAAEASSRLLSFHSLSGREKAPMDAQQCQRDIVAQIRAIKSNRRKDRALSSAEGCRRKAKKQQQEEEEEQQRGGRAVADQQENGADRHGNDEQSKQLQQRQPPPLSPEA